MLSGLASWKMAWVMPAKNFALFESAFRYVLRLRDYPPTSFPIRFGWDGKPKHPITRDLGLAKFNDYNRNLKGALDSPEFNGRRVGHPPFQDVRIFWDRTQPTNESTNPRASEKDVTYLFFFWKRDLRWTCPAHQVGSCFVCNKAGFVFFHVSVLKKNLVV